MYNICAWTEYVCTT